MTRYKISDEQLSEAVAASFSMAEVLRRLNMRWAGGTQTHYTTRVKKAGIDMSHFGSQGWSKGKVFPERRLTAKDILVLLPEGSHRTKTSQLYRAMQELEVPYKCTCGNMGTWNDTPLTLEIDHIDGNPLDNRINNLRYLCPNCHSQQDTNKPWKNSNTVI